MDIDIDFKTSFVPEKIFDSIVKASVIQEGTLKKHPAGYYFQDVPTDPNTNLSAVPYNNAEKFGFFKIDMLHLQSLNNFNSKEELKKYMFEEPDWKLLENESIYDKLFQISLHYETIKKIKPKTVEELADCLALIRPNKTKLIDKYIKDKNGAREILYVKNSPSDLRKSHAIPYAYIIVAQLNLIKKGEL